MRYMDRFMRGRAPHNLSVDQFPDTKSDRSCEANAGAARTAQAASAEIAASKVP